MWKVEMRISIPILCVFGGLAVLWGNSAAAHCTGLHPHHCAAEARDRAKRAAKDLARATAKATEDAARAAEKARADAARATAKAAEDAARAVEKARADAARAAAKAAEDAARAAEKARADAARATAKAAEDAARAAEKAREDVARATAKAAEDVARAEEKARKDAARAIEQAAKDAAKTIEIAIQDFVAETKRAGVNVNDLAIATGNFVENQTHAMGQTLSDAEKRVRSGKIVDAIWHLGTDPLKSTDENAATLVTESSLANNIAAAVSSVYGGTGGAAAYAAWLTYKQTNSLELALKAGIIAGATAKGLKMVNGLPANTSDEAIKKALATASIGGAAVAASGGDEGDVAEAFLKGAALTAAREYYKNVTQKEIEGKAPTKPAVAKLDADGNPKHQYSILVDENKNPILNSAGHKQISIISMSRDISHVGLETSSQNASLLSGAETSIPMQAIAKIPYINDMAYFHDQWAAVSQMQGLELQATIVPAFILTVTGSDNPIIDQATKENIDKGK